MSNYTPIIGLEVHVELKTKSKMFCACRADYFGAEPNTHTCPVCLGLPGALPVPNKQAIQWCIMIAQALNCEVAQFSKFDRKNYFYPDLPKGYQISQYDLPFGANGHMELKSGKRVGITRVHMEEDTGKLTHEGKTSLIDFNRSSVPLVEIVTEPDFNTAEEVTEYLTRLRQIVRYLDVSNADMEKGDMRLEPNISLMPTADFEFPTPKEKLPKYKVEVKNINSFRFVAQAIAFEIKRHTEILSSGELPPQETRGWHEAKQKTISQRVKEEANDYRYFPDPDIPPVRFTDEQIEAIKNQMPELPDAKFKRFSEVYGLSDYDVEQLTKERMLADRFEALIQENTAENITPKLIANALINKQVDLTANNTLVLQKIIELNTKESVADDALQAIIAEVIIEHEKAVTDYKNGKEASLMFLLGQTMRKIGKKVDAGMVKEAIIREIKNS